MSRAFLPFVAKRFPCIPKRVLFREEGGLSATLAPRDLFDLAVFDGTCTNLKHQDPL